MNSFQHLPKDYLKEILEDPLDAKPSDFPKIASICKSWNLAAKELRKRCIQNKELETFFSSIRKDIHSIQPFNHRTFIDWVNQHASAHINQLELLAKKNPFAQFALFKLYGGKYFETELQLVDIARNLAFLGTPFNLFKAYLYLQLAARQLSQARSVLNKFHQDILSSEKSDSPVKEKREAFCVALLAEMANPEHREIASDLFELFFENKKDKYIYRLS